MISEADSNLAVGRRALLNRSRLRQSGLALMLFVGVYSATLAFLPTDVHLLLAASCFITVIVAVGFLTAWPRSNDVPGAYSAAAELTGVATVGLGSLGIAAIVARTRRGSAWPSRVAWTCSALVDT